MDFANHSQVTHVPTTVTDSTSRDEDALRRCALSNSHLKAGDDAAAVEALEELWRGACERPSTERLSDYAAGEVLLQAGRLTSALGNVRRIEDAQEAAKNLLSESAGIFERLGDTRKVAEAHAELGVCYWREGASEEARVVLRTAIEALTQEDAEPKAVALIRLAVVEGMSKHYEMALALLAEAAPLVEASGDDALRGHFHTERATEFRRLADAGDAGMLERAFAEYTTASHYYEQVGHTRHQANTENDLANLFNNAGRYEEAHEHLARARALFALLNDSNAVAQGDDSLARLLTAEGKFEEAEAAALSAVRALEAGDRQALLTEALTTLGVVQARMGRHEEALQSLVRAVEVGEAAGYRTGAGMAALTLVEELGAHLSHAELCEASARAHGSLADTRNLVMLSRLTACARRTFEMFVAARAEGDGMQAGTPEERWAGFSLKNEVMRYEADLISRALRDAEGVVSHAAKLLGFRHHQTFVALLNNRHRELLGERRPVIPRRRSLMRPRRPVQHAGRKA